MPLNWWSLEYAHCISCEGVRHPHKNGCHGYDIKLFLLLRFKLWQSVYSFNLSNLRPAKIIASVFDIFKLETLIMFSEKWCSKESRSGTQNTLLQISNISCLAEKRIPFLLSGKKKAILVQKKHSTKHFYPNFDLSIYLSIYLS